MNVRGFSACMYPLEMEKQQMENIYTSIYPLAYYKCKYFGIMRKRRNTSSTGIYDSKWHLSHHLQFKKHSSPVPLPSR